MITNKMLKNIAGSFLLLALLMGKGNAAITDLATSPITVSATGISALPNIMFVLDDSGSMAYDYLPDWADSAISLDYLYKNSAYNGVAYNAATYYTPPVMYTSSGSPDTSTYPIQNSTTTSSWGSVKNDGYGVQSSTTSNLVNNAVFYTTTPGEYCDGPQLRNCSQVNVPTGAFTYPAKLRWCQTAAAARGTTANSNGGNCQAAQIGLTIANQGNGLSKYRFPRSPSPTPVATITLNGAGSGTLSITGISVGNIPSTSTPAQILSAPVSISILNTSTSFRLKSALDQIVNNINACTVNVAGSCNVTGYVAVHDKIDTISILAPGANTNSVTVTTSASNVITYTTTPFYQTPGSVTKTVISLPNTTTYTYPGSTTKSPNRIDCAGTTCTYEEEMTNYANWWAYYHTRMQAMKTSVSTAFSTIDDQYRVGYFSINNAGAGNGTGSDYININTFNNSQKYSWYAKFFQAYPNGETPLRIALSNAGRVFSGKLSTLNGASVTDPMQYSCQQNFTILSTDGYWNESATPKQTDGTTDIGQQDGLEVRPYYDGSGQQQTSTYTSQRTTQVGSQTSVTYSSTWQQTKTTQLLKQTDTTTVTNPFQIEDRNLVKSTWQLQKQTTALNTTTVQQLAATAKLFYTDYAPTQTTTNLAQTALGVSRSTTPVKKTTYIMYKRVTAVKSDTSDLYKNVTTKVIATEVTTSTGFVKVTSCTPGSSTVAGSLITTECAYTGYSGSPQATSDGTCTQQNVGTYDSNVTAIPTGTTVYGPAIKCSAGAVVSGVTTADSGDTTVTVVPTGSSCVVKTFASPPTASKVECYYDTGTTVTSTTANPITCTYNNTSGSNPSTSSSNNTSWTAYDRTTCSYGSAGSASSVSSCKIAKQTSTTNGTVWSDATNCSYTTGTKVDVSTNGTCNSSEVALAGTNADIGSTLTNSDLRCAYNGTVTTSTVSSCTIQLPSAGPSYTRTSKTDCTNPTTATTPQTETTSCYIQRANSSTGDGAVLLTRRDCTYGSYSTPQAVASCTPGPGTVGPNYFIVDTGVYDANGKSVTEFKGPATSCSTSTTVNNNQTTCTQSNSGGANVTCDTTGTTPWNNSTSCTPATASVSGSTYTAGTNCRYQLAATSNAACSVTAIGDPSNPTDFTKQNPVTCAYQPASGSPGIITYGSSCTNTNMSGQGPVNYTATVWRTCTAGTYVGTPSTVSNTVASCTPTIAAGVDTVTGTVSATSGYVTTNVKTTCAYDATTQTTQNLACNAATDNHAMTSTTTPGQAATTYINCGYSSGGTAGTNYFVPAASCTTVGNADSNYVPTSFTTSGFNRQCKLDVAVDPYKVTTPTQTCTNTSPTGPNYVKTTCTTLIDQTLPVQSCTSQTAAAGNSWVTIQCTPVTNVSSIAVCSTQSPTAANGWQTITCQSTGGTINTLADVAEFYYKTDLRTVALGNCTGSPVGSATVGQTLCGTPDDAYNIVPTSGVDLNRAQHMTTFTLGLGSSGYMQYTSKYASSVDQGGSPDYLAVLNGTTAAPSSGTCGWQNSGACNWPFPITNDQSGIDDLWHAGVNGRGSYFSATDPTTLANSISTALASVNSARGSSTGVATSNPNIAVNDNYIFSTTFTTGTWDGQLVRQQIDTTTGAVNATPDWLAQAKLDNKSVASRNIYTFDSSSGNKLKAFTSANFASNAAFITPNISTAGVGLSQYLCSSPAICLTSADQTAAKGANLVNYLRGDRTNEGARTDNTKYFRERVHILGDIVNSQSVYVSKPTSAYADAGYSTFATNNASRLAVVYAGANDGMLHAFRARGSATAEAAAATAATNNTPANVAAAIAAQAADASASPPVDGGQELWAYIPSSLLPNLYHLADKNYSNNHRYYVDGVQEVADICASSCGTSSAVWKTILVGGLARGGRAYYALDITDPSNPIALWEYTDSNLGYTYGNPQIGKLADGTWVVLFTSGYNNVPNDDGTGGDGQGRLYVLNANTGALIRSIPTGVGTTSSPAGLSKIAAQVVNPIADSTITAVYGGDLLGNLWRFDINNNIGVAGYDAQLLAQLSDSATSSGNPQPITTKPQVGLVDGNVVVYIGTGVYLASSDVDNKNVQSIYAIKDPLSTTGTASTAIYSNPRAAGGFVQQTQTLTTCPSGTSTTICVPGDSVRTTVNNPVSFSTNGGWYLDLQSVSATGVKAALTGERANTDLVLGFGLLIFNTNTPESKACTLGGSSNQYYLDYRTGGAASSSTTGVIGITLGNQLYSSPAIANVNGQPVAISVGSTGTPKTNPIPPNPTPGDTRRTLWRELINQ